MRRFYWLCAAGLFGLLGCGTALLNHRIERKADGWNITLLEFRDGPDSWATGLGMIFGAPEGKRLLHAIVSLRNEAAERRDFNYHTCVLDLGRRTVQPVLLDRAGAVNSLMEHAPESYDAGQKRTRRLIFAYPDERLPTRLQCGSATFELR